MRCEDARAALIDARYAGSDAELADHVAGCAECSALRARHAALDRLLALDAAAPPAPDFDARFFARLEQEKRVPAPRRRARRWLLLAAPALAAAAALLLMLRPRAPEPTALPPNDLGLAMDLELIEELEVVERLDELEAYEVLGQLDERELDQLTEPVP